MSAATLRASVSPLAAPKGLARDLGHTHIAQIQRARIVAATLDVVCERGGVGVTVAHVVERSGVSRRTFYEAFGDRDDCLLAAFEDAFERAAARVVPAYESASRWHERIRAGLTALLTFFDEDPASAHFLVSESLAAGPSVVELRGLAVARLIAAVDAGRYGGKGDADAARSGGMLSAPSPLTGEGAVGGALAIVQSALASATDEPLLRLVNPLMGLIVLPYRGFAAAQRELERRIEVKAVPEGSAGPLADPFKPAGLRLTYRTVRVLLAVGENPRASNRKLGEVAEIRDQGQISKLLGRLNRIGLIENAGLSAGQGAPNAWVLTRGGERMTHSIRTHSDRAASDAHRAPA